LCKKTTTSSLCLIIGSIYNDGKKIVAETISNKATSNEVTSNEVTSNEVTSNELTSNEVTSNQGNFKSG
jgi:hypothetical protein